MGSPKPTSRNYVQKPRPGSSTANSIVRGNPRVADHAILRAKERFGIPKSQGHKWLIRKFRESASEGYHSGAHHRRVGGVRLVISDWVIVTVTPSLDTAPKTKKYPCGCRITYFDGTVDFIQVCQDHADLVGLHSPDQIAMMVENDPVNALRPSDTRQSPSSPRSSTG